MAINMERDGQQQVKVSASQADASQPMRHSNDDSDNINDSYSSDGSNRSYKCCRFYNFLVSHHKPTCKNYVNSTCTNFAGCLTEGGKAIVASSRNIHRR